MTWSVTFPDFVPSTTILSSQVDQNNADLVNAGNTHEAATTSVHGVGSSTIVGTALTQTLSNKDIQISSITSASSTGATWFSNLSIVRATTTNAGDSIKITSASGSALSANNPGYITLPSTSTAGLTTSFTVTADVTILLTGATWGAGGLGDITGCLLRVLALNDNGTLRWGVALLGGRHTVLNTDTNATQASVNLPEEILCNTAVGSATNVCREFGYVRADFDDTGGAAEDLWAVQSGINDVITGHTCDGIFQDTYAAPGFGGFSATPSISTMRWCMVGREITYHFDIGATASNATSFSITNLPSKAKTTQYSSIPSYTDNSAGGTGGACVTSAGSRVLALIKSGDSTSSWTAANNKRASATITYEVGPTASFLS